MLGAIMRSLISNGDLSCQEQHFDNPHGPLLPVEAVVSCLWKPQNLSEQRVHATVLVALRFWDREGIDSAAPELDIASIAGACQPLTAEETPELANLIACDGLYQPPTIVMEVDSGAMHSLRATHPVRLIQLDLDT